MPKWRVSLFMVSCFIGLLSNTVYAQYKTPQRSKWQYELTPYAWFSSIRGDVELKGQTASIDKSFSDILKDLDLAAQVHFEAKKDNWGYFIDPTYAKISGNGDANGVPINADLKQWLVEIGGVRDFPLKPHGQQAYPQSVGILFGARYWNLSSTLNIPGQTLSGTEAWVDPFVGVRYQTAVTPKWTTGGRFDVGGFGVGSDYTLNFLANFNYQTTNNQSAILAYRVLYINRETGSGADQSKYKITYSGPAIAYQWKF